MNHGPIGLSAGWPCQARQWRLAPRTRFARVALTTVRMAWRAAAASPISAREMPIAILGGITGLSEAQAA